jgi:hypothetical protein
LVDMSDPTDPTGVPAVDDVLESLDDLDDQPVEEHVAVFERAHETLRGALEAKPDNGFPPGLRPGS